VNLEYSPPVLPSPVKDSCFSFSCRIPPTVVILSFDGIAKSYGQTVALRGVSFDVHAGEIFGLLGPNGAGKSSLIRILMDIIRQDSGEVRVFGEPRRRKHLDRLGYLPEERGLYTKLNVLDVMTYFGSLKGISRHDARARATEWLERVELPQVARWKVDRLSKGMSQKVQIAAVLLSDPEICVLDEPTTGLDPVNVRLVQDLLIERRRRGRTTILSTHHMNQVEALCDRVALVNHGTLVVYGEVAEVRRRYSLPEVRVHTPGRVPPLPMIAQEVQESDGVWRLLLADGSAPADALAALVAAGARVDRFEPLLAPMEDIFLRVVREGVS
jgi:ABC-2 type transport system ATP-binding protein